MTKFIILQKEHIKDASFLTVNGYHFTKGDELIEIMLPIDSIRSVSYIKKEHKDYVTGALSYSDEYVLLVKGEEKPESLMAPNDRIYLTKEGYEYIMKSLAYMGSLIYNN
jgi:hypothetical protein